MVACETFRVSTADAWRIAWIRASVVDAGGRVRAVGVRETVSGLLATGFERVPYQTVRANAGKRPLRVLASVQFSSLIYISLQKMLSSSRNQLQSLQGLLT